MSVHMCSNKGCSLDLVSDLNTHTFLRSFKRFTSRRGVPSKMISDNGKTFKLASKIIRDIHIKKLMYISLVRSRLTSCSQVWRPMLIKDIVTLERVQRHANKFIVAASSVSYRDRLITLNLLPLMYFYEYLDLLFLVHSLKFPDGSFNIRDHSQFSSHLTCSTSGIKLQVRFCPTNRSRHFFFNRVARLWNALPPIDLSLSISSIKTSLKKILF